ncbi:SMI1/KNR4 family protein [Streptomyces sp. NPDC005435]|uniref:SMI1/KNR4 family protein n=1 Tax=Streptomyces sp. NPDC005435 TaxID=3154464 RepID=UPI0034534FDD
MRAFRGRRRRDKETGTRAVDWDEVRDRTLALYARRGTGSGGLPDVLSETQVRQAEEQFGVEFPEDYRQYLLRVSAGGRVRELRLHGERWDWEGASYGEHEKLHVPFPDHDIALAASEDAWDRRPQREGYASDAAYQADHDAWQEEAYATEAARATGAAVLHDDGCGFYTLLVISGPMRGTMWFDGRATCDRLNPLLTDAHRAATFTDWYLDWLTHEEPLTTPARRRAAYENWRAGVDTPIWYRWFAS